MDLQCSLASLLFPESYHFRSDLFDSCTFVSFIFLKTPSSSFIVISSNCIIYSLHRNIFFSFFFIVICPLFYNIFYFSLNVSFLHFVPLMVLLLVSLLIICLCTTHFYWQHFSYEILPTISFYVCTHLSFTCTPLYPTLFSILY